MLLTTDLAPNIALVTLIVVFVSTVACAVVVTFTWVWGRETTVPGAFVGYILGWISATGMVLGVGSLVNQSENAGQALAVPLGLLLLPFYVPDGFLTPDPRHWALLGAGLLCWLTPLCAALAGGKVGAYLHGTIRPWTGQPVIANVIAPPVVPQDPVAAMEYKAPMIANLHNPEHTQSGEAPTVSPPPIVATKA